MINVPSTMTFPASEALIELEPVMGGAYGLPVSSLVDRSLAGLGDDTTDGIDWTKIITAGTQAATQIIAANRQPYIVPGTTNMVYNPLTGQVGTPIGTTVQQAGMGFAPWAIGGVAVLALLLFAMKK
jgi:hypothetical protein